MNKAGKEGKQNRFAGSHPSYRKRGMSEESRQKKIEYDKEYQKKKSKYRAVLNAKNRKDGTYGNGDGKDAYHKGNKIVGHKSQSANRGSKSDSAGDRRARG